MAGNGREIAARYKRLQDDASNFRKRWDLLAPFVAPSRLGILSEPVPGQSQTKGVYDSTAQFAADIAAKFICGELMNPAMKWIGLREARPELNRRDDVQEWMEETRDRMLRRMNNSNFYAENYETVVDWIGFGTGSLFARESLPSPDKPPGFRGLSCKADRIGRYVIDENADGRVDTHMAEFKLSARNAETMFGAENLPEIIQKAIAAGNIDQSFSFIHAVYPRPSGERRGYGSESMSIASCYVEKESEKVVMESGFRQFPYAVPRWHKTPGEIWGRGPGETALPDTLTLNRTKELELEDLALKVKPPILMAHNSVTGGTIKLRPGASISVRTAGRAVGDMVRPYETGSNPEVTQLKEEELRRSIRQIYFVDQILMLLEVEKSQMTAYEFAKKLELVNRIMGPIYGRWQSEFAIPIIERIFDLMMYAGEFSTPPQILQDLGGDIVIEFEGPLARAQRSGDAESIQNFITDITPMAQAKPETLDVLDFDRASRMIAEVRGVPASVLRSDDEMNQIRGARAEEQGRQAAVAEAAGLSEAARNVAPMIKAMQGQRAA